ncbi:saccharopine dehydrogenase C-terminal domain-containing protein [Actibacterium ureilyticum]|uniref:saccharopine dehydrogenase C-terminal domain-containing protein n=1 Tax=Actibacterium ureilyticum TaxID=1590614 RepID=UPI000BAB179E|nr:saccharopine dehydrogenase C-terminal domain-containing protein [Actibacterium ureilyticum]
MAIHWCGTGLSSGPGLRRLIAAGHDLTVWNLPVAAAQAAVGDLTDRIRTFDIDALADATAPGDVLVSMLPPHLHLMLAQLAVEKGAHFVCSSYIAPELRALDAAARDAGSTLLAEVGLDPGIDHLMAHWLMADYRASGRFDPANEYDFLSYCGGIPKYPNALRYKFSWSPLGVLKALNSPSRSIRNHVTLEVKHPWDAVSDYIAPLPQPERFEVYPNRDSLPYLPEYGFEPGWPVRNFARGTLRLNGWADAWSDIVDTLTTLEDEPGAETALQDLSDRLWAENAYAPDEPDRVVLCVGLRALRGGRAVYDKTYVLDAWGDARGSAMARLVSGTVSQGVEAVLAHQIPAGVHSAPSDPKLVRAWLGHTETLAQHMLVRDHLAG